ncbi:MAG TPA: hypothetical protein DCR71_05415 [Dehalococcoidia bacterium]|nr:hypothetical protein [Dehalococcoidia bacterium]
MSAPKIIGAVLISLILFISLCVFGVALSVKTTALNVSYVASLVDDIPVTEILEEAQKQENITDSEKFDIIKGLVANNEAPLKQQITLFITEIYDYLNSKSDTINLNQLLGDTILNADFVISMLESSDLKPLLEYYIKSIIRDYGLPAGLLVDDYLDDIAADIEPWAKEQAALIIPPALDYILGNSDTFEVTVSIEGLKDALKDNLKQSFLSALPQEFRGLTRTVLGKIFDNLFEQASADIPSSITIDEEFFDSENGESMRIDLSEYEQNLLETRDGIKIFNIAFILLIVLILLLIAGIILIHRSIKWSALNLGVVSFIYGAVTMVFYLSSIWLIRNAVEQNEIAFNPVIRDWLVQVSTGALFPLQILFIVFIIIGIALLATFFVYNRRQPLDTASIYSDTAEYREADINRPFE